MFTVTQQLSRVATSARADVGVVVTRRQRQIVRSATLSLQRSADEARRQIQAFYGVSRAESRQLVGLAILEVLAKGDSVE